MATFLGDYPCKVDAKGRIILPVAFKKQMPADAQDHFVVRKDIFVDCLVLYTMEDWNRQLSSLRKKLNPYNREQNMFLRNYFRGTAELVMDTNSRILIPKRLMDLIGAERDVILAGLDGKIEIWTPEKYQQAVMDPSDFADKAELFMAGSNNEPEE